MKTFLVAHSYDYVKNSSVGVMGCVFSLWLGERLFWGAYIVNAGNNNKFGRDLLVFSRGLFACVDVHVTG